jgi:hypothetical protein
VEALLGRLPERITDAIITLTDEAGSLALPGWGGSFWAWGRKP